MNHHSNDTERPAMFLYLVSKLVVTVVPISAVLLISLTKVGVPIDVISVPFALIIAYFASNWYERLSFEVQVYIEKKYK